MQRTSSLFRLAAVAGTLTIAAASSFAHQQFGESYPYVSGASPSVSQSTAMAAGPMTRADVAQDLKDARRNGTMTPYGELGDNDRTIAARSRANEQQALQIAETYRDQALAAAEEVRYNAELESDVVAALAGIADVDSGDVVAIVDDSSDVLAAATPDADGSSDALEVYSVYLIDAE